MAFQIHSQHVDTAAGFHVIELRDERGNRHLVQIGIGIKSCPGCGAVYPKSNLGEIDPKAIVTEILAKLNRAQDEQKNYAERHGLKVK